MALNKSHVQYVLAQFDNGVPPYQILLGLQYRAFLPSINVATIERCLRDNGRVLNYQQAGNTIQANTIQGNGSLGIGYPSNPLSLSNQGAPGPSTATQGSGQVVTSTAMGTFATADDHFVDPGPTMPWDARADAFALAAYGAGKSADETWTILRSNGYLITRAEVVMNLILQGVQGAR